MHSFLRSIGFKNIDSKKKLQKIITDVINSSSKTDYTEYPGEENCMLMECNKFYGEDFGLTVCGQFDDDNHYIFDYYYPFLKGRNVSCKGDVSIERYSDKESYAGVCEDSRFGVTLIFYLQNMVSYLKRDNKSSDSFEDVSITLSALAKKGKVLLQIQKSEKQREEKEKENRSRSELITQARLGNEDAMENLTIADMDTYTAIAEKIVKEDVFSIVDTYFMPYGVECDQYSILSEILSVEKKINSYTNESVYLMTVKCNDMIFDVCINEDDILGVPEAGRRFMGNIWMQGHIDI